MGFRKLTQKQLQQLRHSGFSPSSDIMQTLKKAKVQGHEVKAVHPGFQWLVMARKDRQCRVIKTTLASVAPVELSTRLGLVFSRLGDIRACAARTENAFGPAQLS